jgi:hypothetical protein
VDEGDGKGVDEVKEGKMLPNGKDKRSTILFRSPPSEAPVTLDT